MAFKFRLALLSLLIFFFIACDSAEDASPEPDVPDDSLIVSLKGTVFDAALLRAKVTLMQVDNTTPLSDPVFTDLEGEFTLPGIDLSQFDDSAILYLQIEGQGDGTNCSDDPSSDTFVDINGNNSFDVSNDECIGEMASLKSYLGTVNTLSELEEENSGQLDSAHLPELNITHVTTAKSALVESILGDSTDDRQSKAVFLLDAVDIIAPNDLKTKKQIAKLATIIRAATHQDISTDSDLWQSIENFGLVETVNAIAKGDVTLDADEDQAIQEYFANDESQYLSLALELTPDESLSDVSFDNPELENSLTHYQSIQDLADLHLAQQHELAQYWEGGTMDEAGLLNVIPDHFHINYVYNGLDRDQRIGGFIRYVNEYPVKEEIFLNVRLSRLCDASGDLFFDMTNDVFTHVSGSNLPIFRRLGQNITRFMDESVKSYDYDDFTGYLVVDYDGKLRRIGNRRKFKAKLAASNFGGQKKINLYVQDPYSMNSGSRFEITDVLVEVTGDSNLENLSLEDLRYRDSSILKWANDCASDTTTDSDILCLNRFKLHKYVDTNDDWASWIHRSNPGSDRTSHYFEIPVVWEPQVGSMYRFTITYNDHLTGLTAGTEVIEKKMQLFPSDDYLAKLVDSNGNYMVRDSVGNDSSIDLNWVYKANEEDPRIYYPNETYQRIYLWDPIGGESIDGENINSKFNGNRRSITLVGDFSSFVEMEASINLFLPNGTKSTSNFTLMKDSYGNWNATQFTWAHVTGWMRLTEDLVNHQTSSGRSISFDVNSNGRIAPSMTFEENDFKIQPWDDVAISRDMIFEPWKNYWMPIEGVDLGYKSDTPAEDPSAKITFTPFYTNQQVTLDTYKHYPKESEDDLVQNVNVTGTSEYLNVTWDLPVNASTLVNSNRFVIRIYARENEDSNWGDRIVDYRTNESNYSMSGDNIIPANTGQVRVDVRATHSGWHYSVNFTLICSIDQITSGECTSGLRQDIRENAQDLIVDVGMASHNISTDGGAKYFYFDSVAGSDYKIKLSLDSTTDDWNALPINQIGVYDSDWNDVGIQEWQRPDIWKAVVSKPAAERYYIVLVDNTADVGGSNFEIGVYTKPDIGDIAALPVSSTVQSGDIEFYSFERLRGINHLITITGGSSGCSNGGLLAVHLNDIYGDMRYAGAVGFFSGNDPTGYFLPGTELNRQGIAFVISQSLSDCSYEIFMDDVSADGLTPENALDATGLNSNLGMLEVGTKRYYQFTPSQSADHQISIAGPAAFRVSIFNGLPNIPDSPMTQIDRDTNAVPSCNTVLPFEWDSMECSVNLLSGTTYYLEIQKEDGENDSHYVFGIIEQ